MVNPLGGRKLQRQMLETVIHVATAKVIEELHKVVRDEIRTAVNEATETVLRRLDQIEDKVEQHALGPLRAGLTFARLGQWEDARNEFVRAHGIDPLSPIAALWLGQALVRLGRDREASDFVQLAITLNPQLFMRHLGHSLREGVGAERWVHKLPSPAARGVLSPPKRFRDKIVEKWFAPNNAAVGVACGLSGSPVVEWVTAQGELEDANKRILTAFEPGSGVVRWATIDEQYLLFGATPRFVFSHDAKTRDRIQIRDVASGAVLRQVTRRYFESAFQPPVNDVETSLFTWKAISLPEARQRSRGEELSRIEGLISGFSHEGSHYHEIGVACLLGKTTEIVIRNHYRHRHTTRNSPFGSNVWCDLVAHAYVSEREYPSVPAA